MKFNFMSFMLGIIWALSFVYALQNYEEITRSGWVIPKVYFYILWLGIFALWLIYWILLAFTEGEAPTIIDTRDEAKNETAQTTDTEELVELPFAYPQIKATHHEKTTTN